MIEAMRISLQFMLYGLMQVFVLNELTLFELATPHLLVLFIVMLPLELNRVAFYFLAFSLGLLVDAFTLSPVGAHALACLTVAGFRQLWVSLITPQIALGGREEIVAQRQPLSWQLSYILPLLLVYEVCYGLLADWGLHATTLLKMLSSAVYSALLGFVALVLFYRKS